MYGSYGKKTGMITNHPRVSSFFINSTIKRPYSASKSVVHTVCLCLGFQVAFARTAAKKSVKYLPSPRLIDWPVAKRKRPNAASVSSFPLLSHVRRPNILRRVLKSALIRFSERGTSYSLYRVLARLSFVLEYTRRNSRRLRGSTRPQRAAETKREPQLNR